MKYGMTINPIEGDTYYECEADSKEEAIAIGQYYANNNLCYGVDEDSIEEVD